MTVFIVILALFVFVFLLFLIILCVKLAALRRGKQDADREYRAQTYGKMSFEGTVKHLTILPLIDFFTDDERLMTESGVSYHITADDTAILMDVGFNSAGTHPSPLLHNLTTLGVSLDALDALFISHVHLDHVGGVTDQKEHTFSISQGPVSLPAIPVYTPDTISPSAWNPGPIPQVIPDPILIQPGIASIGAIPRYLFHLGYTIEHSLAVNLAGKGIALIIGCGHQTIERIIERTKMLFDEPIYAIIGGLHYPVNGGRMWKGPLNIQRIVGSDRPPWISITEEDVDKAVTVMEKEHPHCMALSAHDSSDWSIEQFRSAFGDRFQVIRVGKSITL